MYINAFDLGRETAQHIREFYSLSKADKTAFLRGLQQEAGRDGICDTHFLNQLGEQLAALYNIKSLEPQPVANPVNTSRFVGAGQTVHTASKGC
jgi:hypothetical protein